MTSSFILYNKEEPLFHSNDLKESDFCELENKEDEYNIGEIVLIDPYSKGYEEDIEIESFFSNPNLNPNLPFKECGLCYSPISECYYDEEPLDLNQYKYGNKGYSSSTACVPISLILSIYFLRSLNSNDIRTFPIQKIFMIASKLWDQWKKNQIKSKIIGDDYPTTDNLINTNFSLDLEFINKEECFGNIYSEYTKIANDIANDKIYINLEDLINKIISSKQKIATVYTYKHNAITILYSPDVNNNLIVFDSHGSIYNRENNSLYTFYEPINLIKFLRSGYNRKKIHSIDINNIKEKLIHANQFSCVLLSNL